MIHLSSQARLFSSVLRRRPQAFSIINGSAAYPEIRGSVLFYQTEYGVLTVADISGLPSPKEVCTDPVFAFHIHSGSVCAGNAQDMFADVMAHYNPNNCQHPYHAGDMPLLFGNNGYAFQVFLTDRFSVDEIINRTVIIHSRPDDFTTQPSGNSGEKIACGEIRRLA